MSIEKKEKDYSAVTDKAIQESIQLAKVSLQV